MRPPLERSREEHEGWVTCKHDQPELFGNGKFGHEIARRNASNSANNRLEGPITGVLSLTQREQELHCGGSVGIATSPAVGPGSPPFSLREMLGSTRVIA